MEAPGKLRCGEPEASRQARTVGLSWENSVCRAWEATIPCGLPEPGRGADFRTPRPALMESRVFKTIEWADDGVVMIDQRALPTREEYLTLRTPSEVAWAIREMVIRGAPAIGVAAAMGVALAAHQARGRTSDGMEEAFEEACREIGATRPTAVNLFWALARMRALFHQSRQGAGNDRLADLLVAEAKRILEEDVAMNRRLGEYGADLMPQEGTVLTHCNAGALATGGYGTALGVIRSAVARGKSIRVMADETRPLLQGARLTAWELQKDGIPATLITDGMSGHFMRKGEIRAAVVGADRIAANGDTANKIGTYGLATLARAHGVKFMIAAPKRSTTRRSSASRRASARSSSCWRPARAAWRSRPRWA